MDMVDIDMNDIEFTDIVSFTQQDMRAEFRDYFGYAIMGDMWDETKPSKCEDSCDAEYEMCCVQVAMQDMETQVSSYESYCMIQDEAVMQDFEMGMSGYDIKMKCDKDNKPQKGGKGKGPMGMMDSSVRLVSGLFSAILVIASVC
jgi:hypothetical protein